MRLLSSIELEHIAGGNTPGQTRFVLQADGPPVEEWWEYGWYQPLSAEGGSGYYTYGWSVPVTGAEGQTSWQIVSLN